MKKEEFMKELERRLAVVSKEERSEALAFYEDYFADAGAELEEQVIAELGSPEKVARTILADLKGAGATVEYTERGCTDGAFSEKYEITKPYEVAETPQKETQSDTRQAQNAPNGGGQESSRADTQGTGRGVTVERRRGGASTLLLVVLLVFTFPLWFGILMTFLGLWIGAFCMAAGLIIGFGAAAAACFICGIIVFGYGLVRLFMLPFYGMALLGGGILLFGIGMLFLLLTIGCVRLASLLCKGIGALCNLIFSRKKVVTA